jgi:hypothetical protein
VCLLLPVANVSPSPATPRGAGTRDSLAFFPAESQYLQKKCGSARRKPPGSYSPGARSRSSRSPVSGVRAEPRKRSAPTTESSARVALLRQTVPSLPPKPSKRAAKAAGRACAPGPRLAPPAVRPPFAPNSAANARIRARKRAIGRAFATQGAARTQNQRALRRARRSAPTYAGSHKRALARSLSRFLGSPPSRPRAPVRSGVGAAECVFFGHGHGHGHVYGGPETSSVFAAKLVDRDTVALHPAVDLHARFAELAAYCRYVALMIDE